MNSSPDCTTYQYLSRRIRDAGNASESKIRGQKEISDTSSATVRDAPSAPHRTETKMASMTSSLVGQRLTVKTNKAVKARNVQVKAMAAKPKVITKAADLRLIGKAVTAAEELGLLGIADGISLASIEKAGLLSTAEKVIYDRNSPGTISTLGLVLAAAGAGAVYAIPDETTTDVVLQVVVASACAVGFGVSLTASSLLRKLQN